MIYIESVCKGNMDIERAGEGEDGAEVEGEGESPFGLAMQGQRWWRGRE